MHPSESAERLATRPEQVGGYFSRLVERTHLARRLIGIEEFDVPFRKRVQSLTDGNTTAILVATQRRPGIYMYRRGV